MEKVGNKQPLAKDASHLSSLIVKRIGTILREKKYRQKDLATLLGKSEAEISKWMRGGHNFTIETVQAIERALQQPILTVVEDDQPLIYGKVHQNLVMMKSSFGTFLRLTYAPGVKAGFPSPAEQYEVEGLDFNRDMIAHPDTTFYARVVGDSMINAGISDGDIVVVDRSLEPHNKDIVVAFYDHQYTLKYFDDSHKAEGYINLVPANDRYPVFKVTENDDCTIWGVVKYTIKTWRR
jgi:DNA polymerase V